MRYLIYLFISLLYFTNCKVQQESRVMRKTISETGLIHTVYLWLNEDISESSKKAFEQSLIDLSEVPSIDKFYWGPPADTESRDVVDGSYDYAINAFFKSVAAQEAYQIDPIHVKFVEEQKHHFKKVIVYDNKY